MIVLATLLTILVMAATGLVLFRGLARYLHASASMPGEGELLLLGVLPGLALVGALTTWLAVAHLLQPWILALVAVGVFVLLRKDAWALAGGLRDLARACVAGLKQGDFFPLLAVAAGILIFLSGLLFSLTPPENIDIWVFHIPLAQSLIAHHGFVPHLIVSPFYNALPLFFETLFAVALSAVDHYLAADGVNLAILFGLMLLVLSFTRQLRSVQFLVVFWVLFWMADFPRDAAQPMIDLPRSCFSVAAYLFAYRYAASLSRFDLVMAALTAGAAVAGKYTELVTPALIGLALLPTIARYRTWMHLFPAAIVFLAVAGFWYAKNAILFGNPVYPFLFGHPGFSDQWMKDYMLDIGRPFDPADRVYSTNLLTFKGWHDFALALAKYFPALLVPLILSITGLILPRPRRWMMPLWSVCLFVLWYVLMFNGPRWAISAVLLFTINAILVWFWVSDRVLETHGPRWPLPLLKAARLQLDRGLDIALRWLGTHPRPWSVLFSSLLCGVILVGLAQIPLHAGNFLLPSWLEREQAVALFKPARRVQLLEQTRPGYAMYRYIGEHDLTHVLAPFDNGAFYYVSAYNGGRPNVWVYPFKALPARAVELDGFMTNDIRYVVVPDAVRPLDMERMGADHVAMAWAVVARLKPHAHAIFRDGKGLTLYQVDRP
jgi:hypothetical protein